MNVIEARNLIVASIDASDSHNSVYELAKTGRLQGFLDAMFDIPGGLNEVELLDGDLEKLAPTSEGR